MAINRDIRDVSEGNDPDPEPRFAPLLAQAWADAQQHEHTRSRTDVDRYVRLGWAGGCARKIGYQILELPETEPSDLASLWRMNLGSLVHDVMDGVASALAGDTQPELSIGAEADERFGFPVSGRADLFVVEDDGHRVLIEYKTVGGFKFKSQIGANSKPAEGPDGTALMQAAMYGYALDADEIVCVSLSLECLSAPALAKHVGRNGGAEAPWRKFCAEWSMQSEQFRPMAEQEIARLAKIAKMADDYVAARDIFDHESAGATEGSALSLASLLPPRSIPHQMPPRARVVDPLKDGMWVFEIDGNVLESGTTWMCGYCSQQSRCVADGPS